EGLVFGARAGVAMQEPPRAAELKRDRIVGADLRVAPDGRTHPEARTHRSAPTRAGTGIPDLMWRQAGLFRTRDGLADAVAQLDAAFAAPAERIRAAPADADTWRQPKLATV